MDTYLSEREVDALFYEQQQEGTSWQRIARELAASHALLSAKNQSLMSALVGLFSNEHISLGDLVYDVRDGEGEGWDGPSVRQWIRAVEKAEAMIQLSPETVTKASDLLNNPASS